MKFTFMCRNRSFYRTEMLAFLWLLIFYSHSIAASTEHVFYDRTWWNATDTGQRTEFLAGYLDCGSSDPGNSALENAQWNVIESEITRYYSIHVHTAEKVPALLVRFGSGRPPSTDPAPEVYPGAHGFFDGDYWRQLSEPERIGFVEGYFACNESGSHGHGPHVHPINWYVDKVSTFYCFTGNTCADEHVSENERVPEKIAIVLQRIEAK